MLPRARFILVLVLGLIVPSGAARAAGAPALDAIDPVRFSYDDAIVERALIRARDGLTMLAVDVIRPRTDEPVPAILIQSPYYNTNGRGWRHELKIPWSTGLPDARNLQPRVAFPEWYDEYFVPRGYAIVLQDQRGTRNSSGCQVYGGPEEIDDAVDTIHWIAARPWSNGSVGMTGGSYDGTIAIGAAAAAPEPLKAIIPIRAIDRWYDYHFFNGVQSEDHLLTPWFFTSVEPASDGQSSASEDDLFGVHAAERKACTGTIGAAVAAQYSLPYQDATAPFWAARDYLKDAARFRAATFIVHGLEDENVKPFNAGNLWSALPEGLPKRLWLLRMPHDDPASPRLEFPVRDRFVEATHRWFARYLKGLSTGVEQEPRVVVQSEWGVWHEAADWPPPTNDLVLRLSEEGLTASGAASGTLTFGQLVGGPVTLESAPLTAPMRLAGQTAIRLRYSLPSGGDATFAAALWDSGPIWETLIARGYARAAFRKQTAERGPSWPSVPESQMPAAIERIAFPLWHHDYVVPAGHRIMLRLGVDDGLVAGAQTGLGVTLHLGEGTEIALPAAPPR